MAKITISVTFFIIINIKRQVAYQGLLGLDILPRLMTELLLL